ncbi:hypothetical protein OHB53_08905 [Streptomyces sp. NBC_00056]|uniref:hypothetical protein n=1 Tax=Streptomyces sp. NBC_00056 TaxID=2975633 RepID=UPI0032473D0E
MNLARLWVEFAPQLGPGETADVRLAPLQPEQWQHLKPGDVITMHDAQPAVGIAEIIEVCRLVFEPMDQAGVRYPQGTTVSHRHGSRCVGRRLCGGRAC